mmetsp:Transcript_6642/g.10229  ORF Transcript_6642/g.10229 Transcript_6642/m.10229 type:complete len:278 (-) Transcript_6642:643-1476(-)
MVLTNLPLLLAVTTRRKSLVVSSKMHVNQANIYQHWYLTLSRCSTNAALSKKDSFGCLVLPKPSSNIWFNTIAAIGLISHLNLMFILLQVYSNNTFVISKNQCFPTTNMWILSQLMLVVCTILISKLVIPNILSMLCQNTIAKPSNISLHFCVVSRPRPTSTKWLVTILQRCLDPIFSKNVVQTCFRSLSRLPKSIQWSTPSFSTTTSFLNKEKCPHANQVVLCPVPAPNLIMKANLMIPLIFHSNKAILYRLCSKAPMVGGAESVMASLENFLPLM